LLNINPIEMKKLLAFAILAAFLTSCSQYTCPTYSKHEAPKKTTVRNS
jgi:PBP1b-binding outer membrane lipoprotein LpoB